MVRGQRVVKTGVDVDRKNPHQGYCDRGDFFVIFSIKLVVPIRRESTERVKKKRVCI